MAGELPLITRLRRAGLATLAAVLVVLGAPPGSASAQASGRIRIDLDQLTPRVVETTTQTITVSGKITNTGDRRIDRITVRLQRGDPLTTETALRGALDQPQQTTAVTKPSATTPTFQDVAADLRSGETTGFTLTVPLGVLKIDSPGVYPVAVNFNGVPDYGTTERIGALSALLPVLSVPGGTPVAPPADPSSIGLLWPLIDDQPRQIDIPIDGGQPIFAEDGLAESLSRGRLLGLLGTAASADSSVLQSLCFAIDPDLIATVKAMSDGYQVRGPDGSVGAGTGQEVAKLWLSRLRELVKGRCVIAMPFADADLVALSRSDTVDLQTVAMSAASTLEQTLGVKPLPGVVWPERGTLDQRTLTDLANARRTTVLADTSRLVRATGSAPYSLGSDALRAVGYDPLVESSLAPRVAVESGVRTASVQNGLATLVFRGVFQANPAKTVLIAPPRRWGVSVADLRVFLQTLQALYASGHAKPLSLTDLVGGTTLGAAGGLDYSPQDSAEEIPAPVTAEVARINTVQRELIKNVFSEDDTVGLDPAVLLTPITNGLLRATSTAWRDTPARASAAVGAVDNQLTSLLARVTISDPGIPLALASSESPIPVFVTNGLPVTVRAKINVGDTPGLRPQQTIYVRIPARHPSSHYIPVEVTRAGRFTVDVWLTTESGTVLGQTSRVKLNSTSYGSITLAVTGIAAGALVLLVGLRVVRRIRSRRAAAAADEL
ncbi:probable secreted protein [Alloactinosynnema sp. L-07]|uniref:DUF6049 family protein n=1 Tax=Alloactinosynnema sp. L-07 TaxID=1653480 RepID=UPI00065EF664|nr:DUF6049 family protein [Alloactinosynnema sp. L-07]CRK60691.1 probable secreted protein [Alloactinosynnema sp. L-07]